MLLTIDIGSTNVTLGVFSEGVLGRTFRLQSRREQTSDEYAVALAQLLGLSAPCGSDVEHAIIASVVPRLTPVLAQAVRRAFGREAFVVTSATDVGVVLAVEHPAELGIDRIVNVAAAREWLSSEARSAGAEPPGAIVVDLGTATTFDCLSPAGELVGGVIVPGMRVSFDALISRTSRLPDVELLAPAHVLGKNTRDCLQSGIVYGYASLVDGLVAKLKAELGFVCRVLATGGLAAVVAPHAPSLERVEPELTLRGLELIWRRSQRSGA